MLTVAESARPLQSDDSGSFNFPERKITDGRSACNSGLPLPASAAPRHIPDDMTYKTAFFSVMLLLAFDSDAAEPWDWHVTPYLWAAGIDGSASVANVSADLSADFEDIVNVLQGGILLRVEAKSGSNGLFGDLVFLALEEEDARDTIGGTLEADLDSLIVEGGYRRYTGDAFAIDLGVRYWDFETELTPAVIPAASSSRDWVDGFIGARFESDLGEHWDWVLRGNVGAGGSDLGLGFRGRPATRVCQRQPDDGRFPLPGHLL